MGLSAVCDCGISLSYSLTIFVLENRQILIPRKVIVLKTKFSIYQSIVIIMLWQLDPMNIVGSKTAPLKHIAA